MPDRLDRYRAMRDFEVTAEPAGAPPAPAGGDAPRFVIQEHHATALHWDVRLERDGVLASWAVPKGLPADPRVNHLAVHTEDHPLEYLTFSGDIAEGQYGAGRMTIWDRGTYECEKWHDDETKGEVMVVLHGERVRGRYVFFRTRGRQWMAHRMDPPEDAGRELVPRGWTPMLATPADAATAASLLPEAAVEVEWPGRRLLVAVDGGRAVTSDGSGSWAPLRDLGLALGATQVVLDATLVAFGPDGLPAPDLLRPGGRARQAAVLGDLVWLDGHSLTERPWSERRARLEEVVPAGPAWQVAGLHDAASTDDLDALAGAAAARGLPALVVKDRASAYEPGTVTARWLRVSGAGG